MFNLINIEIKKGLRKNLYRYLLLGEFILTFICFFAFKNKDITQHNYNFAYGALNYIINISILNTILVLVTIIISSEIIGNEFSQKTIKLILIREKSRSQILLFKLIAILIFVLIQYMIILIPTIILICIFYSNFISVSIFSSVLYNFVNTTLIGLLFSILVAVTLALISKSTAFSSIATELMWTLGVQLSFSSFSSFRSYYIYYYINFPINMTGNSTLFAYTILAIYSCILLTFSFIYFNKIQVN